MDAHAHSLSGNSPWTRFSKRNRAWLRREAERVDESRQNDAPSGEDIRAYVLQAIAPGYRNSLPVDQELDHLKRAVALIHEACEEEVITEPEADALVNALVAGFVQRRLEGLLGDLAPARHKRGFLFRRERSEE